MERMHKHPYRDKLHPWEHPMSKAPKRKEEGEKEPATKRMKKTSIESICAGVLVHVRV